MRLYEVLKHSGGEVLGITHRPAPGQLGVEIVPSSVSQHVIEEAFNQISLYLINLNEQSAKEGGAIILNEVDSGSNDLSGSAIEYFVVPNDKGENTLVLFFNRNTNDMSETNQMAHIPIPQRVIDEKSIDVEFGLLLRNKLEAMINTSADALRYSARERASLKKL